MFAVVKIAGQQFKVQEGQSLYVPHLSGKNGDKVAFSEVLLVDNNGKLYISMIVEKTIPLAQMLKQLLQLKY